jgi:uncharacterized protein YwqG
VQPLSKELDEYFGKCTRAYNDIVRRQNAVWRFDKHAYSYLDQETGVLQLFMADGTVVEADAEIVGTVCGMSWEWAWNNPNIEGRMKPSGDIFRRFGEKHNLPYYSLGMLPAVMAAQANLFLSVAFDLAKADGLFIVDNDELKVCCLLRKIRYGAKVEPGYRPEVPVKPPRPGQKMRDEFKAILLRGGCPEDMASKFSGLVEPSISLKTEPADESQIAVGACKTGGRPDLGPNTKWPEWNGEPLAFLAQLDLAQLREYEVCSTLPPTGLLLFFYEQAQATRGNTPTDRDGWRVLYEPESAVLGRRAFPDGLKIRFPACHLRHREVSSLPEDSSSALADLDLSDVELDVWGQIRDQLRAQESGGTHHLLFGHPGQLQEDMRIGCQLASHGVEWGNDMEWNDERTPLLLAGAGVWQMLLQLDCDAAAGFAWPERGRIFFWLDEGDLRAKNFAKAWMILQVSPPPEA